MKHFEPSCFELTAVSEVSSFTIAPFVLEDSVLTACWVTIFCAEETILEIEASDFAVLISKSSNSFTLAEICGPEKKGSREEQR